MAKDDIILSKKHGVNPSMMICPICDETTGIALLGKLKGDAEAPRQILGTHPCKECEEKAGADKVYILSMDEDHNLHGYVLAPKSILTIDVGGCVIAMHKKEFDEVFADAINKSKNAS